MLKPVWIVVVAGCLLASGCGIARYPVLPAWSANEESALTCDQLAQEREAAQATQRRLAEIAARGDGGERPQLYSTARPDADRAVQARLAAVEAALQVKRCAA